MRTKTCDRCGDTYEASGRSAANRKYCPPCSPKAKKEKEHQLRKVTPPGPRRNAYKLVCGHECLLSIPPGPESLFCYRCDNWVPQDRSERVQKRLEAIKSRKVDRKCSRGHHIDGPDKIASDGRCKECRTISKRQSRERERRARALKG